MPFRISFPWGVILRRSFMVKMNCGMEGLLQRDARSCVNAAGGAGAGDDHFRSTAREGRVASPAGSFSTRCSRSPPCAPPAKKVLVEGIEQRHAVLETRRVLGVLPREPGDEVVEARGLLPVELRILQVDVVDDLGDRVQRGRGEGEGAQ